MNVYDFDGTIYRGDCSIDFFLYCLKKKPWLIIFTPFQLMMFIAYKLRIVSIERAKSAFFIFLRSMKNTPDIVRLFWLKNSKKIEQWYLQQKRKDDVIISASPDFLLKPICADMHVQLICTVVDVNTGKLLKRNCKGQEKVRQFNEIFQNKLIDKFYTDSLSDLPLLKVAKSAYLVKSRNKKKSIKKINL